MEAKLSGSFETLLLSTITSPIVGLDKEAISDKIVLFPLPLAPFKTISSPLFIVRLILSTALTLLFLLISKSL